MASSPRKGFASAAAAPPAVEEQLVVVEEELPTEPAAALEDTSTASPAEPAPAKQSYLMRVEQHTAVAAAIKDAWGLELALEDVTAEGFWLRPAPRYLERFAQWMRQRWAGGLGVDRSRGAVQLVVHPEGGYVPGAGAAPAREW